ncbi:hypothetical protein ACZ90_02075 [Streptomyces albus subsp. albus]|nr:hypothetical protein ACZ90_02075 [Streptomyces albus subsp. albus]
MEAVILILVILFVSVMGLGGYLTAKALRAAKRGVDRTLIQARRTVEETALRAKSHGHPGPAGELAQLRLSLRGSLRGTRETLHAGAATDPSLSESLALFERLSAHGQALEEELRRAERETDRGRLAARLPELRERTERVRHSADSLRWAAQDRAREFEEDDLAELGRQIELETGALRHWTPEVAGAPGRDATADRGGVLRRDGAPERDGAPRRDRVPGRD